MALFGFGKKNKKDAPKQKEMAREAKEELAPVKRIVAPTEGFSPVLLGTRVTEKASLLTEKSNAYAFNVSTDANKANIADAVAKLYKVHPVKVRIIKVPSKQVFVRGKRGVKRGGRKAYVYIKEGEKIDIA